ncbi:MAG: beta-galactosidase [Bacillota bacterium]|nr:beta-galactosidase [Bacillota bacterium]
MTAWQPDEQGRLFDRILYGGDYNPEQWPEEVRQRDRELFPEAGLNSVSINIFAWASLQPDAETYDFSDLDSIFDSMEADGYQIVLATATASMPAWLARLHPEVNRVDYEGRRHRHGRRHNFCPTSPAYRHFAGELVSRIAGRYGRRRGLVCWHVNNEYGGRCYCELCEAAFQKWLAAKYGTVERLNEAWNLKFWGHNIRSWEDVVVPNLLGDGMADGRTTFAGLSLDYDRFQSGQLLSLFTMERDLIREHDPVNPITTNFMGLYKPLDYFRWAGEMDLVSLDNYPSRDSEPWANAMLHELTRSLKRGQPYMLMEQTPSQQNWQRWNTLKRPGQMRQMSYQALANGADTVQFFQLRRSRGGCEKFHGAVIAHAGHGETRVFREVAALGRELAALSTSGLPGTRVLTPVGMLMSWEIYWGLEYTSGPSVDLRYHEQLNHYYHGFHRLGVNVDMVHPDFDLADYRVLIAPVLYMLSAEQARRLCDWVRAGGTLVTTYMSGIADLSDNVWLGGYPGPLRELTGIWAEEIDALLPGHRNAMLPTAAAAEWLGEGGAERYSCGLLCDRIHAGTASVLATYESDFYAGEPCFTVNRYGDGLCFYLASMPEAALLVRLYGRILAAADVAVIPDLPEGIEVSLRQRGAEHYRFVINTGNEPRTLVRSLKPEGAGSLVTPGEGGSDTELEAYAVRIYRWEEGQ